MKRKITHACLCLAATALLGACGQKEVSFSADVQPILKKYCLECHVQGGEGQVKSGLLMADYEGLMKGTQFGPIIKPGNTLESVLVQLIEGRANPAITMPHGREAMPAEATATLKKWVEQGAKKN
ncbi:MAG: c-type cytochrome domain-containing protein [Rhodoferax sp.]